MTLRLAAALALALGLVALGGFLHLMGRGPFAPAEARHLRAMKNRREAPATVAPITLAEIEALPSRRPLAEFAALERRGAVLEGYVQRMVRAPDGDIHLEIAAGPPPPPAPHQRYVTAEITPAWYRGAPAWSYDALLALFRPYVEGEHAARWSLPPRRVRITGWLLYDFQNNPVPPGATRSTTIRVSAWELHPVTRIEAWDDDAGGYVEVPR